jgi:hypothetical protein
VQKQRPDGSWANVTSVTPQKTWRVSGTAGIYRLAYLRACNRPYAASSGRAVLVGRPAAAPGPVVTTPQPVVTSPPSAPRPVVTTSPSTGSGGPYYPNCAAARAAGAAPLHRGEPGYRPGLDRDGDGVAGE